MPPVLSTLFQSRTSRTDFATWMTLVHFGGNTSHASLDLEVLWIGLGVLWICLGVPWICLGVPWFKTARLNDWNRNGSLHR